MLDQPVDVLAHARAHREVPRDEQHRHEGDGEAAARGAGRGLCLGHALRTLGSGRRVDQGPEGIVRARIGGVSFGVGAPLVAGLLSDLSVLLRKMPPTEPVGALRAGDMDGALVSSVEAVRAPGSTVVDVLGLARQREIRSGRAFRRRGKPIRSVGLDR